VRFCNLRFSIAICKSHHRLVVTTCLAIESNKYRCDVLPRRFTRVPFRRSPTARELVNTLRFETSVTLERCIFTKFARAKIIAASVLGVPKTRQNCLRFEFAVWIAMLVMPIRREPPKSLMLTINTIWYETPSLVRCGKNGGQG